MVLLTIRFNALLPQDKTKTEKLEMKTQKVEHTTIRNGDLFCLNCGGSYKIPMPTFATTMVEKTDLFNSLHADCAKTWKEPEADQSKGIKEKALFWMSNGQRGMSSETMWSCLMGVTEHRINYPHDPDDFSRCYKLLQFVPEWRLELGKLKTLHPVWEKLVDNWDTLTEMYERNVRENWKHVDEIKMYEFMKKLGC
jgi:hypothetical protein